MLTEKHGFLNRNALKYLVTALMLLDHVVYAFVPSTLPIYFILRIPARTVAPTMAFFLAEGYMHTRNVRAYALRLLLFALLSWSPFCFFASGGWLPVGVFAGNVSVNAPHIYLPLLNCTLAVRELSVIFTLFLGLLAILLWDRAKLHPVFKVLLTAVILLVSSHADWGGVLVLLCLCFRRFRDAPAKLWTGFVLLVLLDTAGIGFSVQAFPSCFSIHPNLFSLGMLLTVPLLTLCYNGEPGSKKPFHKWFFYIFYPAHLLILDALLLLHRR